MKYACIEANRAAFLVRMMCRLLAVKACGFHTWRRQGPSCPVTDSERLKGQTAQVHAQSDGVYGSPKVREELLGQGERVGRTASHD